MNLHLWLEYRIVCITESLEVSISDSISAACKKQTVLHYNPENKILILASIKRYWSEQERGHYDKTELQAAGGGKEETDFSIYLNTLKKIFNDISNKKHMSTRPKCNDRACGEHTETLHHALNICSVTWDFKTKVMVMYPCVYNIKNSLIDLSSALSLCQ